MDDADHFHCDCACPPTVLATPGATAFGFDFNPTVDRIRVVTDAGDNFRLNPNTGAAVIPLTPRSIRQDR